MNDEELRKLHDIFNDCWKLLKQNIDAKADDGYWDSLIDQSKAIREKHGRNPLSLNLTTAICDYLDKECRAKYPKK